MVISRCCFSKDGKDIYQDSNRTYTVIVLLIKPFVWCCSRRRRRRRRRRGLLKLPIIVAMLLLISPARDGKYNTYICRGNDCQIEPLGPDVFDVVSDVLEIVRDIITLSVLIVNIEQNEEF